MFRSFLRLTFRNLWNNKLYSLVNIAGLAIGIACTILIVLWIADEYSYDKTLPRYERLHQVYVNASFDGEVNTWQSVPLPTYEAMKTADHRIINSTVTGWGSEHLLTVGNTRLVQEGLFVSEEFLEMFEFPLVSGDAKTVLDDPSGIVISESTAKALFQEMDPIGKIIKIDDKYDLKVVGILRDLPDNSSFRFKYLLTWKFREQTNPWVVENKENWGNYSFQVYVEVNDPENNASADLAIRDMLSEHGQTDIDRSLFLHPLPKWRLQSTFENGKIAGGMIDYVQLFSAIALLILVIACINFMNLSTARAENRMREVGVRKSVGASRFQIMSQFIGESLLIAFIAYILAFIIVLVTLPGYNLLVDKNLSIDITSPAFLLGSLLLIFTTGVIAGSYPAFYLSSFKPTSILKGTIKVGKGANLPRKILVIFQFGFAILLMTGSFAIYRQINLVQKRALGYDQSNLINFERTDDLDKNYDVLKNELIQSGLIESMTRSNSKITSINSNNFVGWPGKPEELKVIFTTITTEYDYCETYGVDILAGRDFSREFPNDTSAIIINKAALDLMGLEDPIGTQLDLWGEKRRLIGVIDNVLMGSLYREVKPLFMIIEDWGGVLTARLRPGLDMQNTLQEIENIFNKYNPAYPFEYSFVDDDFKDKFSTIRMTQRLSNIFTFLAIFITGLGLFGLASFMAAQRTREMGIRKVLGASMVSLITLMSRDFSRLVLISLLITIPLSWYLINNYLERYPIRVNVEWWIYLIVGALILIFTLLIVGTQARRVARANPAHSLRNLE
ncbi:MAG: ABC transporter permease [Saprospiraceae bacterium]|nr:ABC transporter permease [Saprospiraceae bacterium]